MLAHTQVVRICSRPTASTMSIGTIEPDALSQVLSAIISSNNTRIRIMMIPRLTGSDTSRNHTRQAKNNSKEPIISVADFYSSVRRPCPPPPIGNPTCTRKRHRGGEGGTGSWRPPEMCIRTYRDCVFHPRLCATSPSHDPSSAVCNPSPDRYLLVFPGGGPVRVRFAGTGCFVGRWRLSVERDGRPGLEGGMSDKEGKG